MGFGTEILFLVMLGLVVLGPKRLHSVLGYVRRAKTEFEKASREIKSQVSAEVQRASQDSKHSSAEATVKWVANLAVADEGPLLDSAVFTSHRE